MIVEQSQCEIAEREYCKPIPLTWERMDQFDLPKGKHGWKINETVLIEWDRVGFHPVVLDYDMGGTDEIGKKIEYVHQLQNLVFALTGEELQLKAGQTKLI